MRPDKGSAYEAAPGVREHFEVAMGLPGSACRVGLAQAGAINPETVAITRARLSFLKAHRRDLGIGMDQHGDEGSTVGAPEHVLDRRYRAMARRVSPPGRGSIASGPDPRIGCSSTALEHERVPLAVDLGGIEPEIIEVGASARGKQQVGP